MTPTPEEIVSPIVNTDLDLLILCNAGGYIPFLDQYSKIIKIPIIVLTGGGPDLINEVQKYTPYIMKVPFFPSMKLYEKIEEILG